MGLDMYLERCKNVVFPYVSIDIEELKESEKEDDKRLLEFLKPYIRQRGKYVQWDSLSEEVGYWRKANQIHRWFVDNIQDGEDNCGAYKVDKEELEELLGICKQIEENAVMKKGQVVNGQTVKDGEWVNIYEDGYNIINPEVCEELLPTCSGFFFGSTEYDQWYMDDIQRTIEQLEKVIEETDWETEIVYYSSSW